MNPAPIIHQKHIITPCTCQVRPCTHWRLAHPGRVQQWLVPTAVTNTWT